METWNVSVVCETIWMAWAFVSVGIIYSVLGPTILDLQIFLKEDIETLSTASLSFGIGETTGVLLTFFLAKFGSKRLHLAVSLLLSSIVVAIIPVTNSYIYVDVMFFLGGLLSAIPSCFLLDVCSELWKERATAFQAILLGCSLGAFITPLIAQPFLCHKREGVDFGSYTDLNTANRITSLLPTTMHRQDITEICSVENLKIIHDKCLNFDNHDGDVHIEKVINGTSVLHLCLCIAISLGNNTYDKTMKIKLFPWDRICSVSSINQTNLTKDNSQKAVEIFRDRCCSLMDLFHHCAGNNGSGLTTKCTEEESHVRTAYVVLGLIELPASLAIFYFWWRRDSRWATDAISVEQLQEYKEFGRAKHGLLQGCIFYTLFFLSYIPVTALNITYNTYLTAIGVQGRLHLSKSTMVYMTSLLWISGLAGRVFCTVCTYLVGNTKVIIGNLSGLVITGILMMMLAPYYASVLWVGTFLLGLFSLHFIGGGVAWAAGHVGMSFHLVATSCLAMATGNIIFPFIGGIMFENIRPFSVLYLLAGLIIFLCVMFGVMNMLVKNLRTYNCQNIPNMQNLTLMSHPELTLNTHDHPIGNKYP